MSQCCLQEWDGSGWVKGEYTGEESAGSDSVGRAIRGALGKSSVLEASWNIRTWPQ